ncbi:MAG TPA: hypothetical protein PLD20_21680 [Blastocatellia bacterium]|nr:hypothetical protein [Blastocatellia bacterium]HMZ20563.1 hypothetical protein [Blastocatellia bacterium]HNG30097.1 hypothetical protein [Blastocatellia bacterium]
MNDVKPIFHDALMKESLFLHVYMSAQRKLVVPAGKGYSRFDRLLPRCGEGGNFIVQTPAGSEARSVRVLRFPRVRFQQNPDETIGK